MSAPALAQAESPPQTVSNDSVKTTSKTVDGFSAVRQEVVSMIATATKRIWLSADYLTDGDVVSGLYLAQYRKINVQVLLGRRKANAYMSRLGFLKNQNIPVFLKPDGFTSPPTALLIDDKMITIDGDLDFRANYRKFTISLASANDAKTFEAAFAKAANVAIPAHADPVPMVGRDRGGRSKYYSGPPPAAVSQEKAAPAPGAAVTRGKRYRPPMGSAKYSDEEMQGSYGYNYNDKKAPQGVPKLLPKQPLYQKLEEQRSKAPPPGSESKDLSSDVKEEAGTPPPAGGSSGTGNETDKKSQDADGQEKAGEDQ